MTIDRVATNNQTSYMLSQIAKANVKLQQSENQVTTGKIATDYAGIGNQTAALQGAHGTAGFSHGGTSRDAGTRAVTPGMSQA